MPSFVNLGAHVGAGSMIDTWATVGSCAQIGRDCHISGGAGIGELGDHVHHVAEDLTAWLEGAVAGLPAA